MGFFTDTKGRIRKIDGKDGTITSPINTPSHSTSQESKVRHLSFLKHRNDNIKSTHEEQIRLKKLDIAQREKIRQKRIDRHDKLVAEIEARRHILMTARTDPTVLDELNRVEILGKNDAQILPRGSVISNEKQEQFLNQEAQKFKEKIDENADHINTITKQREQTERKIKELERDHQEFKENAKGNPLNNPFETTRKINETVTKLTDEKNRLFELEKEKAELVNDTKTIQKKTEEIKRMREKPLNQLPLSKTTPNLSQSGVLPLITNEYGNVYDSTHEHRERTYNADQLKRTGKGFSKAFPEGGMHNRKVRTPGKQGFQYTARIPDGTYFSGEFDENDDPIYLKKDMGSFAPPPETHHIQGSAEDIPQPQPQPDKKSRIGNLNIIPSLAKGVS